MRNQSLSKVRRVSQVMGTWHGVSEPETSKESIYAGGQPGRRGQQRRDEVTVHGGSQPSVGGHSPRRGRVLSEERVVGTWFQNSDGVKRTALWEREAAGLEN